jgi:glycerate kinase
MAIRILIAPNAFKNSLPAEEAAEAIRKGLMQSKLKCECKLFPIGDGGDGTGRLLTAHLNGTTVKTIVHDPLGRKIEAAFGLVEETQTAIIEMAEASGLKLIKTSELDPLHSTSFGTGEMINHALDYNVKNIFLAVGGTATIDGGCGVLKALGMRLLDNEGRELKNLPEKLKDLATLDFSEGDKAITGCAINILCDVNNPLLGDDGAASVFGPQKGADAKGIILLEAGLQRLANVVRSQCGTDISKTQRGGAAGGVAAVLNGVLNANLVSGIDHFLELTGFEKKLNDTDILITGEGSIDEQTLQGKGPFGVAKRAKEKGIFVIGLGGKVPENPSAEFMKYFDVLMPIQKKGDELAVAIKATRENLIRTSQHVGDLLFRKALK